MTSLFNDNENIACESCGFVVIQKNNGDEYPYIAIYSSKNQK